MALLSQPERPETKPIGPNIPETPQQPDTNNNTGNYTMYSQYTYRNSSIVIFKKAMQATTNSDPNLFRSYFAWCGYFYDATENGILRKGMQKLDEYLSANGGTDGEDTSLRKKNENGGYDDFTLPDGSSSGDDDSKQEEQTINPNGGGDTDTEGIPEMDWQAIWDNILSQLQNLDRMLSNPDEWIKLFKSMVESFHLLLGNKDSIWKDMSHSDQRNFIMDIVNKYYNFMTAMYQNYYSQEMWMLQQSYNSPLEQAQRLAAAGLFNGFGNQITSGNAETAAGSAAIEGTQGYEDRGSELQQQKRANTINAINSVFSGIGSIASAAQSFGALYSTAKMTPANKAVALHTLSNLDADTSHKRQMAFWHGINIVGNLQLGAQTIAKDLFMNKYSNDTQLQIAKMNNQNAWDIKVGDWQNAKDVADIQGNFGVQTSTISANATKYAAKKAYEAAIEGYNTEKKKAYANILKDGVFKAYEFWEKMSVVKTSEKYWDVAANAEIHADYTIGGKAGIPQLAEASSSLTMGGEFELGGKYYRKEVVQEKELNPAFFAHMEAILTACDEASLGLMSDDELDKYNKIVSGMYAKFQKVKPVIIKSQGAEAARQFEHQLKTNVDEINKQLKKRYSNAHQ